MENKQIHPDDAQIQKGFSLPIYETFDPNVDLYLYSMSVLGYEHAVPYEYSGWRNEVMSWKENCYLHAGLNPAPTYRVKGPDAIRLFSDISVNSYAKFPIDTIKHCIMCNEAGLIMADGVLLRTGEEEFVSYFLAPYLAYKLESGNYRATGEFITDTFIFQLAGPRSLEILEAATGECIHDIKFGHRRLSKISDKDIEIVRLGMAGTLAYEVHGLTIDAETVYKTLELAGEPYGLRKLGRRAYQLNHTEGGFPQSYMHFPYPFSSDQGFIEYLGKMKKTRGSATLLTGSMGTDLKLRYRNPVELGWEKMIKFDHDFIGRAALTKEVANPRRRMVTLVWNTEDVVDVYASQLRPGEPYMPMEPHDFSQTNGNIVLLADQVLKDGKVVGISSGRIHSYYFRQMISLCSIDTDLSAEGNEVEVLWGNPGSRQKMIRATVSRFPYLNENRNEKVDVNTIPCRFESKG